MDRKKTQVLQWGRRVRDFLVEQDLKSEIAELPAIRQELDEALGQLTVNAAAQEAITKQSRCRRRKFSGSEKICGTRISSPSFG